MHVENAFFAMLLVSAYFINYDDNSLWPLVHHKGEHRNEGIVKRASDSAAASEGIRCPPMDQVTAYNRVFSQTPFRTVVAPHGLSSVQEGERSSGAKSCLRKHSNHYVLLGYYLCDYSTVGWRIPDTG